MESIKRRKFLEQQRKEKQENCIRVLVITSQPLLDDESNDFAPLHLPDLKEEREKLAQIFKDAGISVRLHIVAEATYSEVVLALQKSWDIVHFTGHGTEEDGSLLLEDGYGCTYRLSREPFKEMLQKTDAKLLFLSACFSEQFGRELIQSKESISNIRSIVTVKAELPISQDAAIVFAENFYKGIANGHHVGSAFSLARHTLKAHPFAATISNVQTNSKPEHQSFKEAPGKLALTSDNELPTYDRFVLLGDETLRFNVVEGECRETGIHERMIEGLLRPRKSTFIGRETELTQIIQAFAKDKSPRVCLFGTGGIGKTELSIAAGWWFAERGRIDNVLFLSGNSAEADRKVVDLITFLFHVIKSFRLPIGEGTQLEGIKKGVLKFFQSKRNFIIIDEWESIENKFDLWNFLLSLTPNNKLLITSRSILNPTDVLNIEVTPLNALNSRRLFWVIVKNTGYFQHRETLDGNEIAILARIGEELGGMPLAIEVAAGNTHKMDLKELWDQLSKAPQSVLETKDSTTGLAKGVWTSLGLSFQTLQQEDRDLIIQMSIFQNPIHPVELAFILRQPVEMILQSISRLFINSLVRKHKNDMYSMYPVVKQFASVQLSRDIAIQLHFNATSFFMSQGSLESTLRASTHLYQLSVDYELVVARELFVLYFCSHYEEWYVQGKWYKTISIAQKAVEISKLLGGKEMLGFVLYGLGELYAKIGEITHSIKVFNELSDIGKEISNPLLVSTANYFLGILYWTQGNMKEAKSFMDSSVSIAKDNNYIKRIAEGMAFTAVFLESIGKQQEARSTHQESIRLKEQLLPYEDQFASYHKEILLCMDGKDEAKVQELIQNIFKVIWHVGVWRSLVDGMGRLAMTEYSMGNIGKALELLDYCLNLSNQRNYSMGTFIIVNRIGTIKAQEKRFDEAKTLLREVLVQVKEIGSSWLYVDTLIQLALIHIKTEDYDQASDLLSQAVEFSEELGYKKGLLDASKHLAKLDFDNKNYALAIPLLKDALKQNELITNRLEVANLYYQLAVCYEEEKIFHKSVRNYRKSLEVHQTLSSGQQKQSDIETIKLKIDQISRDHNITNDSKQQLDDYVHKSNHIHTK